MYITYQPIYQSPYSIRCKLTISVVEQFPELGQPGSPLGQSHVWLDAKPFILTQGDRAPELMNPDVTLQAIRKHTSIKSFLSLAIDRDKLKPGEEQFLDFYFRKIEPTCMGSTEKGATKKRREECIIALHHNKLLWDFIKTYVLPNENLTKPLAISKLFNDNFSSSSIGHDLDRLRKEELIPDHRQKPRYREDKGALPTIKKHDPGSNTASDSFAEKNRNIPNNRTDTKEITSYKSETSLVESHNNETAPCYTQHVNEVLQRKLGLSRRRP
ncbi:hypothetical protein [Halomonas sp. NO4]|uniref:hypothetical protein n=1 Tax=Halomonas sp. NO4 TaxID=2484813 RepID=UPI0013D080F0|nr:hypothetical protein [Halomonas sp. NO4]